jgi:hypothetical protein
LFEHDLFGKPVSTFPDHALAPVRKSGPRPTFDIEAEEERAQVHDVSDPAYPMLARHLRARRDNISMTITALQRRLQEEQTARQNYLEAGSSNNDRTVEAIRNRVRRFLDMAFRLPRLLPVQDDLEPFPLRSNRSGTLDSCFDAFS